MEAIVAIHCRLAISKGGGGGARIDKLRGAKPPLNKTLVATIVLSEGLINFCAHEENCDSQFIYSGIMTMKTHLHTQYDMFPFSAADQYCT